LKGTMEELGWILFTFIYIVVLLALGEIAWLILKKPRC